jgi:hypothetical protein
MEILTWRLNSQLRHAGRDPASSLFLDSRLRGNDNPRVFNCRSNKYRKYMAQVNRYIKITDLLYTGGIIIMPKLKFGEWKNPGKVFITGASSGIGASYAKAFAESGFDLVLLARRKDRLQALANLLESDFSIHCEIITADLSEKEDIKKAANHIRQIDNLDILINNAGFATIGNFADIPIEKSMRMFHTHMTATVQFTHAALQIDA